MTRPTASPLPAVRVNRRVRGRPVRRLLAVLGAVTGLIVVAQPPLSASASASASAAQYQRTVRVNVSSTGGEANMDSNGTLEAPAISANGRYVAFVSYSSNLVPADTNGTGDVFVHDTATGKTRRISVSSSGAQGNRPSGSGGPAISADGRYVAFTSLASNLVPADTNGSWDAFVHDTATGITRRVNVSNTGAQANGHSFDLAMSADGRHVAFLSYATNLVPADTNGAQDVFVRDLAAGRTRRASISSTGGQADKNSISTGLALSADGRKVTFDSDATNLVPADTNGTSDVFIRDMATGTTRRASVSSTGAQGNGDSWRPTISADGRRIAFQSTSTNLVPGDPTGGGFVRDTATGQTQRAADGAWDAVISADGRHIAFTAAGALTPDWPDVFTRDMSTGKIRRVSVSNTGAPANSSSGAPTLSTDGRYVAFLSLASNLVAGDTNSSYDVFLRHMAG